jgi:hypothetical protein
METITMQFLRMSEFVKTCTNIAPRPDPRDRTAWLILATSEGVGSNPLLKTTVLATSLKTKSSTCDKNEEIRKKKPI